MTILLGILLAFLIFFVVVMIHEFGHFITARMVGMRVLEFGLGIPPKIKKIFTDKKGTNYTINALPIGGFVRIDGEDISKPSAFDEGNFMSKKLHKRLLVLFAGILMNFILAFVIFVGLFMTGIKPLSPIPFDIGRTNSYFLPSFEEALDSGYIKSEDIILHPLPDSIAQNSGLQSGDIVSSLNGQKIYNIDDFVSIIKKNETFNLEIIRKVGENSENLKFSLTPQDSKIGVSINSGYKINPNFANKKNFSESIILGAKETYFSSILTVKLVGKTLGKLFFPSDDNEREEAKKSLSGPIGVANATIDMVENSVPVSMILLFMALLSINLAVMNLLPFPALDGGRIIFTTIYSILHRLGISKQKILIIEGYIHTIGFLILIVFMIYVAGLDLSRLFN